MKDNHVRKDITRFSEKFYTSREKNSTVQKKKRLCRKGQKVQVVPLTVGVFNSGPKEGQSCCKDLTKRS